MLGSKFITKQKAASILGVSTRTISRYLARGLLKAAHDGKRIGAFEEEVLHFKRNQAEEVPLAVNRMSFGMLVARVQSLEHLVGTMARILNIRYEPLKLTDPEYLTLYRMAEQYATEGWPPHAEDMWADTFLRIKLDDLEAIARITEDEHPWRPLLRLAKSMHAKPYQPELREQFASGLTNIHGTSSIYCIMKGESPKMFDLLVERGAIPDKKLMRNLSKTRH